MIPNSHTPVWLTALCVLAAFTAWFVVRFLPADGIGVMPLSVLPQSVISAKEVIFDLPDKTDAKPIVCRKNGNTWFIKSDENTFRADSDRITLLLEALAGNFIKDRVNTRQRKSRNLNLDDFGLENPSATIHVTFSDGRTSKVMIGRDALYDGTVFAKTDKSGDVYIVGGIIRDLIPQSLNDARNKAVFPISPESIVRIEVLDGSGVKSLVKEENGWMLSSPFRAKADDSKVESILNIVRSANVSDFVANIRPAAKGDESDSLFPYGLSSEDAVMTVSIWTERSQTPEKFIFGHAAPDSPNDIFVYSSPEHTVFSSPISLLNAFSLNPEELREHALFNSSGHKIMGITLRTPDFTISLECDPSGIWSFSHPTHQPADAAAVAKYISDLESVKDSGLYVPSGTGPVVTRLNSSLSVAMDGGIEWNAGISAAGESDRIFVKIAADNFTRIVRKEDMPANLFAGQTFANMRDKSIISVAPGEVVSVTQRNYGSAPVVALRRNDSWICSRNSARANTEKLEKLTSLLSDLRASEVDCLISNDDAAKGFSPPVCEIALTMNSENASDAVLQFGAKTSSGKSRLLRVKGTAAVFVVPEKTASIFMSPIAIPKSDDKSVPDNKH